MLISKTGKSGAFLTRGAASSRYLAGSVSAVALATLLSGCGMGKPGTSEIENALTAGYRCSPFVVKNITRVDGAPVSDTVYDVSFRYQVEFRGGEQGALDYFSKRNTLVKALKAARSEGATPDDSVWKLASQKAAKINEELDLIWFGGCRSPRTGTALTSEMMLVQQHLSNLVESRFKNDVGPMAFPYGATVFAVARAGKAESGWAIFESRNPQVEQVMDTDPQRVER